MDFFRSFGSLGFHNMLKGGLGVILSAVSFDDLECVYRTNIQAGAHSVTEDLFDEHGFFFFIQNQRTFRAGRGAKPAPVALLPIDLNDLTLRHNSSARETSS